MSRKHILTILLTIVAVVAVGGALAYDTLKVADLTGKQGEQTRGLAVDTGKVSVLAHQIQAERVATIRASCKSLNARHSNTITQLDKILVKAERAAPPVRRAQIQESRASTVLLIDSLAPYRNCEKEVLAATSPPKRPKVSLPSRLTPLPPSQEKTVDPQAFRPARQGHQDRRGPVRVRPRRR